MKLITLTFLIFMFIGCSTRSRLVILEIIIRDEIYEVNSNDEDAIIKLAKMNPGSEGIVTIIKDANGIEIAVVNGLKLKDNKILGRQGKVLMLNNEYNGKNIFLDVDQ